MITLNNAIKKWGLARYRKRWPRRKHVLALTDADWKRTVVAFMNVPAEHYDCEYGCMDDGYTKALIWIEGTNLDEQVHVRVDSLKSLFDELDAIQRGK